MEQMRLVCDILINSFTKLHEIYVHEHLPRKCAKSTPGENAHNDDESSGSSTSGSSGSPTSGSSGSSTSGSSGSSTSGSDTDLSDY